MFRVKNETEAQKILRKARSILIKRGWVQGKLTDARGRCCTIGAFAEAAFGSAHSDAPWTRKHKVSSPEFTAAVALRTVTGTRVIAKWNDAPGRTKAEVLEVFKVAYTIAGDI